MYHNFLMFFLVEYEGQPPPPTQYQDHINFCSSDIVGGDVKKDNNCYCYRHHHNCHDHYDCTDLVCRPELAPNGFLSSAISAY